MGIKLFSVEKVVLADIRQALHYKNSNEGMPLKQKFWLLPCLVEDQLNGWLIMSKQNF